MTTPSTQAQACWVLEQQDAIEAVIKAYSACIDHRRAQELERLVFAHDVMVDMGYGEWRGGGEATRRMVEVVELFERTSHALSNFRVDIDGDLARSTTYVTAWHWLRELGSHGTERPASFVTAGLYIDRLRRDRLGWRIAERRFRRLGPSATVIGRLPGFLTESPPK
jgi:SnoaL-like domain